MNQINRRSFLKKTAAVGAGVSVLPKFNIGKPGPSANSKVNVAMVGAGNIAGMAYGGVQTENVVALADIDSRMFPARDSKYGALTEKAQKFEDFRVMLDKMWKDIDAVCINCPDHNHFVATIAAMERGLHVCTQKPLTHNIWESRTLLKAKEKYGVITNMANQGHTYNGIRQMKEWYEAGVFGQIKEVHMGLAGPNWNSRYFSKPSKKLPLPAQPVPKEVNWDLWCGPRPKTGYNSMLHPLKWRGYYDYGTGMFGDWFCHIGDGPVWILDLYEPTVIESEVRPASVDGFSPDYSVTRFDFPKHCKRDACSMYWYDGKQNGGPAIKHPEEWDLGNVPDRGSFWFGEKQNAYLDERSNNPRLTTKEAFKAFEKGKNIPEKYPRVKSRGPHQEWIHAIKGEGPEPGSNFSYSAPMSEVALLGVLAQRFGGKIEWDSKNMKITNRPELNEFVQEPVRKGWEAGRDLWKA